MKKRLLSAALALAMALTLLPMSVFAANEPDASGPVSGKTTVYYTNGLDSSKLDASGNPVAKGWAWQYKNTADNNKLVWASSDSLTGIVSGTSGTQGTYYDTTGMVNATTGALVTTSFTLLSALEVTSAHLGTTTGASLSVNTFGSALTFATGAPEKINTLTVTDTIKSVDSTATVGSVAITRDVGTYTQGSTTMSASGLTLNVTDAGATISLTGRGNRVTLTHVVVTGELKLDGTTRVTNTNGTSATTYDSQSLTINPQAAWPFAKSSAGSVNVKGDGSTVTLNGVNVGTGAVQVTSSKTGSVTMGNGASSGMLTIATRDEKATDTPPTVTINDATVAGVTYEKGTKCTSPATVTVNAQGVVTAPIAVDTGTVSIHSANVNNVTVKQGTLNMDGAGGTAGTITLAEDGKTTFNFSGTGWTVDSLTTTNGGSLTIGSNWPVGRSNTFKALTLTDYTGQGIKGGVFGGAGVATNRAWFAPDLQFARKFDTTNFALYGTRELAAAIADAGTDAATAGTIDVIGTTATKYVKFFNSMLDAGADTAIAQVGYGKSTGIYLPDKINGTAVATWTNLANAKEYGINEEVPISIEATTNIELVIQSAGAAVSRLTNVTANPTGTANANVTATLNNNQITLSGAVGQDSYEDVKLTLTTDLISNAGTPVTFNVLVSYNTTTKSGKFSTLGMANPPLGVTVNGDNIVVGSNTYTLTTSGLSKPAANLKVAGITGDYGYTSTTITGKSIVPTVNVSGMGNVTKADLIGKLSAGEFNWATSPAMRQVVNQAMTTITTNNQLENWVTAAQRAAWTGLGNKGKTPNADDLATTGYKTAVLEPYMALTVSAYNPSGTMTATLVPSYRVIVVSDTPANMTALAGKSGFTTEGYYIAQSGRALNTPITDLVGGETGVTLKLDSTTKTLPTGFASAVMHQDGTYAYKPVTKTYTITHGGKTGLGTIVLNSTEPLVSLLPAGSTAGTNEKYYDSLQAAIDDTKLSTTANTYDKITVTAAYAEQGGSGVIDVTGEARTFQIETKGQTTITPANKNFTVGVDTTGHTYTVQLTKSIAAAGQNIVVGTATGGSASVNANPAKAGSTVTITLSANAGYTPNGVTVRTSGGQNVSVSGSGSTYTFTMPASGTVTVTPAFKTASTTATVSVSGNSYGTATTTAGNSQVAQGTPVTVSVAPYRGYRTMGLSVTGATATRTGVNQFTFTVPSGYTNVTVTPSFDVDNNTPFSDVWSNRYYSNPIAWAYTNGYTRGATTYTYEPARKCTRAEMVTFLWQAAGSPTGNYSNPFSDVSANNWRWAYNAILWAAHQGLIETNTGKFNPTANITRADVVQILYKRAGSPNYGTRTGFNDVASNSKYARAVTWAHNKGITDGYGDPNRFAPAANITREEVATMLYRAFK